MAPDEWLGNATHQSSQRLPLDKVMERGRRNGGGWAGEGEEGEAEARRGSWERREEGLKLCELTEKGGKETEKRGRRSWSLFPLEMQVSGLERGLSG